MLDILHQDHINISRLLDVLRDKLAALRSEETVRFDLLKDALSYLSEVSDTRHHPREDLFMSTMSHTGAVIRQVSRQCSKISIS
jgi:hypothetical protein